MEEAAYIDQVRLVAYDLPPGWSMVLDERKAISPPEATGDPRFYREERLPSQAVDEEGRDVTRAVSAADGEAAPPGRIDPRFIGRTDDHFLTLRFDRALDGPAGEPMLVADGWIEYPYAQTLFAAWQAGAAYLAPTIEARGADGQWRVLRREFGYPAGMPRRMSVPLGRLPAGTRELRIRTTQEIYWDRLAVAYSEAEPGGDGACPAARLRASRLQRVPPPRDARVASSVVRLRSARSALGHEIPQGPLHRAGPGHRTGRRRRRARSRSSDPAKSCIWSSMRRRRR